MTEPQAARRRRWPLPWWGTVLLILGVIAYFTVMHIQASSTSATAVTYTATSADSTGAETTQVSVTYTTATGQQQSTVSTPWSATLDLGGAPASLVAQAAGDADSVSCTITISGVVMSNNTSNGLGAIATCTS